MRDIVLTIVVFGLVPVVLKRPVVGVLLWTWLSLMNPHRLTWGFAYDLPFAQIVALALFVSLLLSKEPKRIPWSPIVVVWLLFVAWMGITTVFALHPGPALSGLTKVYKIQLICFITLMVMTTQKRLLAYVWVVAFSIGFFGIKGGVFSLLTGFQFHVWGPAGSYIEGNNEVALALIVIVPLMRFLQLQTTSRWISLGLTGCMILCAASILGSQSRGAFLAIIAMGFFMVWKSRQRLLMILVLAVALPVGLGMLPQKYWDRMSTIQTYKDDPSARSRLNAWGFAINLNKARPITGGGFGVFRPEQFLKYAPNPKQFQDAHSIYFEVLGEHGIVGLTLFLIIAIAAYRASARSARLARGDPDLQWHGDLARMAQVSLVGFAVGGAFLGLAYFDLLWNLVVIIVLNRHLLLQRLEAREAEAADEAPPRPVRVGRAAPIGRGLRAGSSAR